MFFDGKPKVGGTSNSILLSKSFQIFNINEILLMSLKKKKKPSVHW